MRGELSHTRRAAAPTEAWPPSRHSPLAAVALVASGGRPSPLCCLLTQHLPQKVPIRHPPGGGGVLLSLPTWAEGQASPLPSQRHAALLFQRR